MRESVSFYQNKGGVILVLDFPFRAIRVNQCWSAAIRLLAEGSFIPLEKLIPRKDPQEPEKVEFFLDGLVREGFLERRGFAGMGTHPLVSVIVPVRNRPIDIEACLRALQQLRYPRERLEIIIVDDASQDTTPEVISCFPVKRMTLNEHKQASYCRNLAARESKGEIVAFVDSDCRVHPDWLSELVPCFRDRSLAAVGGLVDSELEKSALDRYEKVKSSLHMGFRLRRSTGNEPFFYVPSCNLLVRRGPFLKLGGFREDLHVGEDVDLSWRLRDAGYQIEYRPFGVVYHRHRNQLRTFCARRFDYGTSEPMLQQLHPERIKQIPFPLGGAAFWGIVALALFSAFMPLVGLAGLILLADCQLRSRRLKRKEIPFRKGTLIFAVLRSYFAFLYQFSAFVSRYYLLWCPVVFVVSPVAGAIVLGMHLLTGSIEFCIKRADLNLPVFLWYHTLEQLSYQAGVWWGCLRGLCFKPVNPRVVLKTEFSRLL
jgi:mycofactocin system glycosyltransferase